MASKKLWLDPKPRSEWRGLSSNSTFGVHTRGLEEERIDAEGGEEGELEEGIGRVGGAQHDRP